MENSDEWSELQEIKQMSFKEQKMYHERMKKRELKNKTSKTE